MFENLNPIVLDLKSIAYIPIYIYIYLVFNKNQIRTLGWLLFNDRATLYKILSSYHYNIGLPWKEYEHAIE